MLFKKKEKRLTIGLIEPVILENGKKVRAKIDTGADSSSIDKTLLESLGDKKVIAHKYVRSALGRNKRAIVELEVEFCGKKFKEKFTISDRKKLTYKMLIGKDILKKERLLVDPTK